MMGLISDLTSFGHHEQPPAPGTPMPPPSAAEKIPAPAAGAHQRGQTAGRATPDTHPSHFTASEGPRLPAGPWTPNTGSGEAVQGGYAPPVMTRKRDEFDHAESAGTHIVPTPEKGLPRRPVLVEIVPPDSGLDTITVTAGASMSITAEPVQILARDPHRQVAVLTNCGANSNDLIRIGQQSAVSASQGAPLAVGQPYTLHGQEAVYAALDSGATDTSALLSIITEYGSTGPGIQ